jgi:deoxyribose-phosphate aldolase
MSLISLAKMIDHSLLHPTFTDQDIIKGCKLAKSYRVATACVKPYSIELASEILTDSDVLVCTVIAFPQGNSNLNIKIAEVKDALFRGAVEIDMVVNIGKVLSEDWQYVSNEIKEINDVVVQKQAILKVIFENDYLEDFHIIKLCEICSKYRVAFVKTSTGYGFVKQTNGLYAYSGATDFHLRLMRQH